MTQKHRISQRPGHGNSASNEANRAFGACTRGELKSTADVVIVRLTPAYRKCRRGASLFAQQSKSSLEMDGADFIGLSEELNEKTLSEYQALANSTEPGADAELADGAQGCPLVPRIVNIVARVHYGSDLDLLKIATHARNAEYNPKRFPAVTLRIHDPKATGLTFKTGVMNIVGCRTVESAHLAARKFGRILKNLGFPVRMKLFEIVNIVATMDCRFPIHLESLAGSPHKVFTQYNPEIFAGLIYRIMKKPECTFLVFVSGKIVVTGAKSLDIITSAANYIYPILQQFARNVIPEPEAV